MAEEVTRKKPRKSPRAPSFPLQEALDRVIQIYSTEGKHSVPADAAAQALGYSSAARNGRALATLATLKYYGLLDRPSDGYVSVSKDVETYQFVPDEGVRQQLRRKWVRNPPIFAELLDRFPGSLPTETTLRWELMQKGFTPTAAADCVKVFVQSVEFAQPFDEDDARGEAGHGLAEEPASGVPRDSEAPIAPSALLRPPSPRVKDSEITEVSIQRIPVRLRGPGRRWAWLDLPVPFFEADKEQIKLQLDVLVTDDPEEEGAD